MNSVLIGGVAAIATLTAVASFLVLRRLSASDPAREAVLPRTAQVPPSVPASPAAEAQPEVPSAPPPSAPPPMLTPPPPPAPAPDSASPPAPQALRPLAVHHEDDEEEEEDEEDAETVLFSREQISQVLEDLDFEIE